MTRTALDLSPEEWRLYWPDTVNDADQTRPMEELRQQAWSVAQQAANILREEYQATKVVVFGSLAHGDWFKPGSDIDLAAWGIPPELFYKAVAVVTGLSSVFRIDLVDPESCQASLRAAIENEGVEL